MKKTLLLLLIMNNLNASIIRSIDFGIKSFHLGKYEKEKTYTIYEKTFEEKTTTLKINTFDFNENNLSIFVNTNFYNLSVGYLDKNSYGDKTYFLGFNKEIYNNEEISIELKLYGVYGYKKYHTVNALETVKVSKTTYQNTTNLNNVMYKYIYATDLENVNYYFVKTTTEEKTTDIPLYKGLTALGSISLKYKFFEISFIPNIAKITHSIVYTGLTYSF